MWDAVYLIFHFSPNYCGLWGISLDHNLKTTGPDSLQDPFHLSGFVIIDAVLEGLKNLEFREQMDLRIFSVQSPQLEENKTKGQSSQVPRRCIIKLDVFKTHCTQIHQNQFPRLSGLWLKGRKNRSHLQKLSKFVLFLGLWLRILWRARTWSSLRNLIRLGSIPTWKLWHK